MLEAAGVESSMLMGEGLERGCERCTRKTTGQVITDVQRHVKHPALGWMAATLGRPG